MSECVVRMEMPSKDKRCEMADEIKGTGIWFCPIKQQYCHQPDNRVIPSWCPIVCSLPEGHGRLVDGDELYMTVKAHDTKRAVNQVRSGVIEEKHICLHDICQAQTIVPATNTPTDTPTVPVERSET